MGAKEGNKPVFEDKEGNVKLSIFKNKTSKGNKYATLCITVYKFPFTLIRKVYLSVQERDHLIKLFNRMPEIERKEKKE